MLTLWMALTVAAPTPTSADPLMPVYMARVHLAAAERDEESAREALRAVRQRAGVVKQEQRTADQLLRAAFAADDADAIAQATERTEAAIRQRREHEAAVTAATTDAQIAHAVSAVWDATRRYEVARSAAAAEPSATLVRVVERVQAKLTAAEAWLASLRASPTLDE